MDRGFDELLGRCARLLARRGAQEAAAFLGDVDDVRRDRKFHGIDLGSSDMLVLMTAPERVGAWAQVSGAVVEAVRDVSRQLPGPTYEYVEARPTAPDFEPDWRNTLHSPQGSAPAAGAVPSGPASDRTLALTASLLVAHSSGDREFFASLLAAGRGLGDDGPHRLAEVVRLLFGDDAAGAVR